MAVPSSRLFGFGGNASVCGDCPVRAASWSLPLRAAEEKGEGQLPGDFREFALGFEDVREAFEADSKGRGGDASLVERVGVAARSVAGVGAAALAPLVTGVAAASAKGGAYGIYEGKTASFIHPIIMVRQTNGLLRQLSEHGRLTSMDTLVV